MTGTGDLQEGVSALGSTGEQTGGDPDLRPEPSKAFLDLESRGLRIRSFLYFSLSISRVKLKFPHAYRSTAGHRRWVKPRWVKQTVPAAERGFHSAEAAFL